MKPDELFNRIPVVVRNQEGELEERELREKYHKDVIVAYKSFKGYPLSPEYRGLVLTKSFELYELQGTDDIVSHIKAEFMSNEKVSSGEEWIVVDKERFEEYQKVIK